MSTQALVPIAFAGLIGWRIYRRTRRSIGRQPLRSSRAAFSVLMLSLATVAIMGVSLRSSSLLGASAAGLGGGLLLGFLGLRLTAFEAGEAGHFYIPNTYIGIALAVLLAGRIASLYHAPEFRRAATAASCIQSAHHAHGCAHYRLLSCL